jgi:hypothetical protein
VTLKNSLPLAIGCTRSNRTLHFEFGVKLAYSFYL